MHELSICRQIVKQAAAIAAHHDASGIARITLQLGPLCGVEGALIRQAFPIVAATSNVAGAELIIETSPVLIQCKQCGSASHATPNRLVCKVCGDNRTRLLSGDEMLLTSVELIDANRRGESTHV
jgi:hydrogenase nickel incorporation protein HypA/HybF